MFKKWVAAATFMSLSAVAAQSSTLITVSVFDAGTYNSDFGSGPNVGEDFETLGTNLSEGEVAASFGTAVGTFSALGGTGTGGTVTGLAGNTGERLALRQGSVYGRENNTPIDGDWFLDSNDTFGMNWEVSLGGLGFTQLSFVLQDGSDVGAYLRISAGGADKELRTGAKLPNGAAKLVVIDFGEILTEATVTLGNFTESGGGEYFLNDGFSIDGLQVSAVPLPAPILMLGAAIGGLGALRRRQKKQS